MTTPANRGVGRGGPLSGLTTRQSAATDRTWHTDAMVSASSVWDSARRISWGAGTASQIRVGAITMRNRRKPQMEKPILYCLMWNHLREGQLPGPKPWQL